MGLRLSHRSELEPSSCSCMNLDLEQEVSLSSTLLSIKCGYEDLPSKIWGGLNKMYLRYPVLYRDYGRCSVNVNSLIDYITVFN